jgi:L-ribulose-5-phosphate 3-epimerase
VTSIGIMQGRLSPPVNGKIQAFPVAHWREEFPAAKQLGLHCMEWTLDHHNLVENPLMTEAGRREICSLCDAYGIAIPSLTGDCFMQAPFWKEAGGAARKRLVAEFDAIVSVCAASGIGIIVVPLVDQGRLENDEQATSLFATLAERKERLHQAGLRIAFEIDFSPAQLAAWIKTYPPDVFGINYDTGNSASLGYNPKEEIEAYGSWITNVHIKDRLLGGTTVPLGTGHADIPLMLRLLKQTGYSGGFVLQAARGADDVAIARHYKEQLTAWLEEAGFSL